MSDSLTTTKERVLAAAKLGDRERECLKQVFPEAFETSTFYWLGGSGALYMGISQGRAIRITHGIDSVTTRNWPITGDKEDWNDYSLQQGFSGTLHFKNGKHVETRED